MDQHAAALQQKRDEYQQLVSTCYNAATSGASSEQHSAYRKQIQKDLVRMSVLQASNKLVELYERVLYIWALRHPASGYVQVQSFDLLPPSIPSTSLPSCTFLILFIVQNTRHFFQNLHSDCYNRPSLLRKRQYYYSLLIHLSSDWAHTLVTCKVTSAKLRLCDQAVNIPRRFSSLFPSDSLVLSKFTSFSSVNLTFDSSDKRGKSCRFQSCLLACFVPKVYEALEDENCVKKVSFLLSLYV